MMSDLDDLEELTTLTDSGRYWGMSLRGERSECSKGHPLSGDNLARKKCVKNGRVYWFNQCKTCRRASQAATKIRSRNRT